MHASEGGGGRWLVTKCLHSHSLTHSHSLVHKHTLYIYIKYFMYCLPLIYIYIYIYKVGAWPVPLKVAMPSMYRSRTDRMRSVGWLTYYIYV